MACTDKRTILLYCIISYGRNKFYSEGLGLASSGEKAQKIILLKNLKKNLSWY